VKADDVRLEKALIIVRRDVAECAEGIRQPLQFRQAPRRLSEQKVEVHRCDWGALQRRGCVANEYRFEVDSAQRRAVVCSDPAPGRQAGVPSSH
jgi:hypothetical protein